MADRPEFGQTFFDVLRRRSFGAFLARVFETVSPGDDFADNWHLDAIAWELKQIELGVSRRLLVTMPPRHLKSIAISVAWVAWMLGHRPKVRILCVSYSAELAQDHARMCRMVMQSNWYRRAFPRAILRGRAPEMDFRTNVGGGRLATSTGGTLTGRGADIIIIDDPMKSDDAFSDTVRQSCIKWYKNTLVTRPNNKRRSAMILVMQRLHEEDLAGHVLSEGNWRHLNLPAIAMERDRVEIGDNSFYQREIGVPLHPTHEGLEELNALRRSMGSALFDAQFQQQPIPSGGLMVRREWLRYYTIAPTRQDRGQVVQSWDTASREGIDNDYSVCVTAMVRGREVQILDVHRAKMNFPKLLAQSRRLAREWKADVLLIEDAASGTQLIDALKSDPQAGVPTPIGRAATTDKVTRMSGQTARIQAGDLWLPSEARWLAGLEHELLGFPKARYKDQVDALVHLLAWSGERRFAPPTNAGPEIVSPDYYSGYEDDPESDPWL